MQAQSLAKATRGIPAGVSLSGSAEGLASIHDTGCAAAIWRRRPLASFQDWIDGLPPETLPSARLILRPHGVRQAVRQICDSAGTPDCAERDRLIDDVAALADIFADLMQANWLRLRLDVVTTNACRKFHVDTLSARLVCTYRGTGTQYGTGQDGGDPQQICTLPAGSPIVMRGKLWPEQPASGLLHRSPPIEGSGETRLLLVLDPVSDPVEEV